ncbi:MAG: hypothetical protein GX256_10330 [Fretibacterium sp.]|nr:hypothetical protein [Fretibacterium sp.]
MWLNLSRFFPLSLWLLPFHCGSVSGLELLSLLDRSDLAAHGMRWVSSPRQADVLLLAGEILPSAFEVLGRIYRQMPAPKIIVWAQGRSDEDGKLLESHALRHSLPVALRIEECSPEVVFDGIRKAAEMQRKQMDG